VIIWRALKDLRRRWLRHANAEIGADIVSISPQTEAPRRRDADVWYQPSDNSPRFFFFVFFFYSLSLSFSFFLSFSLFRLSLTNFSPKLQVFSLPRVSHSSLLEDHHDKNNSKFFCTFFLACVCVCGSIKFESNFHAPVSFIRTIPWKWIESLSHWRINTSQVQISGSCRLIEADVMDLGAISNFMGL